MTRIRVLPYGPSNSARDLANALDGLRLAANGNSTFRGRTNDLIINWGNSSFDNPRVFGEARVMNRPEHIRMASNKIDAFTEMRRADVSTVDWTTDRAEAQRWLEAGELVYARTRLQGHSGEGIVMAHANMEADSPAFRVDRTLPQARLYTKGITAQRREFRIHVMQGQVTYVQQKKRESGWEQNENYSNLVRNYHTGWIYATSDVRPNNAALSAARSAVAALGLDFGAVDVITRGDNAWVLEVNTAPGLQGTNLETYSANFRAIAEGRPVTVWSPTDVVFADGPGREPARAVEARARVQTEQAMVEDAATRMMRSEIPDEVVMASNVAAAQAAVERQVARPIPVTAATMAQPAAPVVPPAPPVAPSRPAASEFADGAYYFATLDGQGIVVQFNAEVRGFYMPGWEIPLMTNQANFTVGSRVAMPQ